MPTLTSRALRYKKSYLSLLTAGILATGVVHAQESGRTLLQVKVLGLQSSQGQVVANLFGEGDGIFARPLAKQIQPISNKQGTLNFENLIAGRYAVVAFHDINSNGDLDHNFFKLPTEPLGFSNGFELTLVSGLPNSKKLSFSIGPDTQTINVTVR